MNDTAVMRKQKAMFPAVSIRALPEGYLLGSTLFTARLERMRVMLLSSISIIRISKKNRLRESMLSYQHVSDASGMGKYLSGSKMASAMVVKSDKDSEVTAA